MTKLRHNFILSPICSVIALFALVIAPVEAQTIYWVDWQTSSNTNGFTALGTITTPTATVNVTYNNPQGIGFYQTGGGGDTDYWRQGGSGSLGRNPARSPYTSALVANIPTGTDMIALQFAGSQSLTFSEAIANPVFSYISLNGNGYGFDQDFDILSFGDGTVRDIGYWGAGTSSKSTAMVNGNTEYQLLGTGEPHGTIRFAGAFSTVSWRSLTNEFWNGFTVGIQETAAATSTVPEPGVNALIAGSLITGAGFVLRSRRRK